METAATQSGMQRLVHDITACWRTKALHVAVQLQLPDLLADAAQDAPSLAAACGCDADALQRLLRALCTLEVCEQEADGRFALTATGSLLRTQPPDGRPSLHSMALWWGGPMWNVWDGLPYSVGTGRSARERLTGKAQYGFLDGDAELAALFHETMRAQTGMIAGEVAGLEVWQHARELVDVGGGQGALAVAVAVAQRHLRAIVFDRPDAESSATAFFAQRGVADRVRFVAGDFFGALPAADTYLLKSILHNWDDAGCRRILGRCAEAAAEGARLLVVERVLPARLQATARDQALARTDLNMLAGLGGRERSLAEFDALLQAAGFRIERTHALASEFSVIEARRR